MEGGLESLYWMNTWDFLASFTGLDQVAATVLFFSQWHPFTFILYPDTVSKIIKKIQDSVIPGHVSCWPVTAYQMVNNDQSEVPDRQADHCSTGRFSKEAWPFCQCIARKAKSLLMCWIKLRQRSWNPYGKGVRPWFGKPGQVCTDASSGQLLYRSLRAH